MMPIPIPPITEIHNDVFMVSATSFSLSAPKYFPTITVLPDAIPVNRPMISPKRTDVVPPTADRASLPMYFPTTTASAAF